MGYKKTALAIKSLKIQGAQRIALAAVKSLYSCRTKQEIRKAVKLLSATRPTEPCLRNALRFAAMPPVSEHIKLVEQYFKDSSQKITLFGSRRLKQGYTIFTHCHSSTVVKLLLRARSKHIKVHNTETRPFFQGRTTARELASAGIPVTHHVDSSARQAIKRADIMLIGCDAITADGFVVNKIGSEMFAEVANSYDVPVYICTVAWKYDGRTKLGFDEVLEKRFSKEVWQTPPKGVRISNVVFEKIHPRLITGVISEFGITTVQGFLEEVKRAYQWIA